MSISGNQKMLETRCFNVENVKFLDPRGKPYPFGRLSKPRSSTMPPRNHAIGGSLWIKISFKLLVFFITQLPPKPWILQRNQVHVKILAPIS